MYSPKNPYLRAAIEIGFIIFLFYSNLLMGEFTGRAEHGKTLVAAIVDMVKVKNFAIALFTSVVGYFGMTRYVRRLEAVRHLLERCTRSAAKGRNYVS